MDWAFSHDEVSVSWNRLSRRCVQQVLGWSALKTGLTFSATAGTAILWAGPAQALVTKVGPKVVMVAGFVAMAAGMAWYTRIPVDGSYWVDLLPGYLLIGFALPFTFIPVSVAAGRRRTA
jgi:hypothetical protein